MATTDEEQHQIIIPNELPMLAVRDVVVFPNMVLPLFVGRETSVLAIEAALAQDRLIFLATQKDQSVENPEPEEIYSVGTVSLILRMLKLPDGRLKILVQGKAKAMIQEYLQERPYFQVAMEVLPETTVTEISPEAEALMRNAREMSEKILTLKGIMSPDLLAILESIEDPGHLADLVAANLRLKIEEAQMVLEEMDPIRSLIKVNDFLRKEMEVSAIQAKIQNQAREEMDRTQREYFLREQLRAIKKELGDLDETSKEMEEYRLKIARARMPKQAEEDAVKQLSRLEQMHPDAAEASIVRTYLDWLVSLPWSKSTRDKLEVKEAKTILDEDHFDLEKVKDRILEYLSVRKLNKKMKGPILCFVGPPGVGKTSLGQSIARAMGRKFVRISLGGMRDEAEIRGHRRTYIGALPGRIIQGVKNAGSNNPVFILDEVDKIGMDFRGDPAAALLEVLDPEQNHSFSDHYLNVAFDLSKVMFITTANLVDPIPSALRDRMEVIRLAGYTEEEKLEIVLRHLLPRQLTENGLTARDFKISNEVIKQVIMYYTLEAGLRNLEREIGSLCRKVARRIAEGEKGPFAVTRGNLHLYLGPPRYLPEGEVERRSGRGHGPGLDPGGRRDPAGGSQPDERQRPAHPHRSVGRRHEGVGPGGLELRPGPGRPPQSGAGFLREAGHPYPRARRSHPQGRPLGRRHHGHRPDHRPHPDPGAPGRGHDRRNHPPGQGAAHRRPQREGHRGAPGPGPEGHHPRGQQKGPGGNSQKRQAPPQVRAGGRHG